MIRRPPRSTRTDTLFPYTTLFRSARHAAEISPPGRPRAVGREVQGAHEKHRRLADAPHRPFHYGRIRLMPLVELVRLPNGAEAELLRGRLESAGVHAVCFRSEERRVGKECVSTCRSRWSPYHSKKKKTRSRPTNHKKQQH